MSGLLKDIENQKPQSATLIGPLLTGTPHIKGQLVIYIDGGSRHRSPGQVGISIGDGDSFDGPMDISLAKNKNASDLSHGLKLVPNTVDNLQLIGFTGGRLDHEILNLGELHHFLKSKGRPCRAEVGDNIFALSAGQWDFDFDGLFSLIAFEPSVVDLSGKVQFQLGSYLLEAVCSRGLSNVASGSFALVCSSPVFIFRVLDEL